MKSIDIVGIMKTVASVTPLEGDNTFLVKYGNHKQVVIVVSEAAQHSVQPTKGSRPLFSLYLLSKFFPPLRMSLQKIRNTSITQFPVLP